MYKNFLKLNYNKDKKLFKEWAENFIATLPNMQPKIISHMENAN